MIDNTRGFCEVPEKRSLPSKDWQIPHTKLKHGIYSWITRLKSKQTWVDNIVESKKAFSSLRNNLSRTLEHEDNKAIGL